MLCGSRESGNPRLLPPNTVSSAGQEGEVPATMCGRSRGWIYRCWVLRGYSLVAKLLVNTLSLVSFERNSFFVSQIVRFSRRPTSSLTQQGRVEAWGLPLICEKLRSRDFDNPHNGRVFDAPLRRDREKLLRNRVRSTDHARAVHLADFLLDNGRPRKEAIACFTKCFKQCAIVNFTNDLRNYRVAVKPFIQSAAQRGVGAGQQHWRPVKRLWKGIFVPSCCAPL